MAKKHSKSITLTAMVAGAAILAGAAIAPAWAHHSFAMYDTNKVYVFTGVVTRVDPAPTHLMIHFVPLDESRQKVVLNKNGQPDEWSVEMMGSAQSARDGISVNAFPPGTIFSVGLFPLRDGGHAGGRGTSGLFKCPDNVPPAPGKNCDSVEGATSHGKGVLPKPTGPAPN
jgi:hypothetical protein